MASVFKISKAKKWSIVFTDEHGRRRKKIGYVDKRETERYAARLEDRALKIRNGDVDPRDEAYRVHAGRPLAEHLSDFDRSIRATGATERHVVENGQRVRRMLDLAKAKRISDLSLSKALDAVQALRDAGLSQESLNHHIRSVKGFARFLWRDGRARDHALAHMKTSSPESDRRHVRRLLSPEEATLLIRAAENGRKAGGLSGIDRGMLYAIALGTGFRANELRTLTPERFKLDSDTPTVVVAAAYAKNGREAVQPLAQSLADRIRPWLADKAPGRPVFETLARRTAEAIRVDLKAAGIPYRNDSGVVDFHSLRGDYISYLVSSGASVKTCQTLARHANPAMTIGIYAKASLHDINGAVEGLPDLTAPARRPESLRMTGTDASVAKSAACPQGVASDQLTQVESLHNEAYLRGALGAPDHASDVINIDISRSEATSSVNSPSFSRSAGSTRRHDATNRSQHAGGGRYQKQCDSAPQALPSDADLREVNDAWPELPGDVRAAILALVRAAK